MKWLVPAAGLLVVAIGGGFWYSQRHSHEAQIEQVLKAAKERMDAGDLAETARLISAARQHAPQNPAVIRAAVDLLIRANASPAEIAQALKRLTDQPDATVEDFIKLARAEATQGELDAARTALQRLPDDARSSADARQLEAFMLKLEGRDQEAEERLRTALLAAPKTRESAFKLALLDYVQPLPAIHERGRVVLWETAAGDDPLAVHAIQLLTKDSNLTPQEAEKLATLAQDHPEVPQLRFAALATLVRLRPDDRPAILDRESAAALKGSEEQRQEFLRWLSSIEEHDRVLRALPEAAYVKAKDLPAGQLELKLASLAATGRWNEVAALLTRDVEKSLGPVAFNLWSARLAAGQSQEKSRVRQHLKLAFEAATGSNNGIAVVRSAEAAADLGVFDLAGAFYEQMAAKQDGAMRIQVALLEKAFSYHAQGRNTSAMLKVARDVAQVNPDNVQAGFRADYLALLVGDSLELVAQKAGAGSQAEAKQRLLLQALAAHRLHQPMPDLAALKALKHALLPAGQRAVLAAMIASNGDPATGYEIAENISNTLLLPEEARLLTLAR